MIKAAITSQLASTLMSKPPRRMTVMERPHMNPSEVLQANRLRAFHDHHRRNPPAASCARSTVHCGQAKTAAVSAAAGRRGTQPARDTARLEADQCRDSSTSLGWGQYINPQDRMHDHERSRTRYPDRRTGRAH